MVGILKAMNEGEFVIGLYLDLCKAFEPRHLT